MVSRVTARLTIRSGGSAGSDCSGTGPQIADRAPVAVRPPLVVDREVPRPVTLSVNSLGVKSSSTISLRHPVLGLTPLRTALRRMEVPPRSGGQIRFAGKNAPRLQQLRASAANAVGFRP
jgi:hypothetical protein